MHTHHVTLDREKARELYQKYKAHRAYDTPMDAEIRRAYQLIAQGRLIIQAAESIRQAGLNEQGYPKLAIVRADATECWYEARTSGSDPAGIFSMLRWSPRQNEHHSRRIRVPGLGGKPGKSLPPPVPLHLRPKRGLENYHILWEAEWTPTPPRDPYLLRRIGKADLWLVLAMWELTDVERAVLASRIATA